MTRKWVLVSVLILSVLLVLLERREKRKRANESQQKAMLSQKDALWVAPDSSTIPNDESG